MVQTPYMVLLQEIKNLTDDITEYTNEEDGAAHYLKSHLLDN